MTDTNVSQDSNLSPLVEPLKWNDISVELVAEMSEKHDKSNLHYQEQLDENQESISDSVHQVFEKMQKDVLLQNGINSFAQKSNPSKLNIQESETKTKKDETKTDETKTTRKNIDFTILQKKPEFSSKKNMVDECNGQSLDVLSQILFALKEMKTTTNIVHNHYYQ